jgi:7,8-dihydropterin-6-yl-methyl-4-(beta-D-ribofuranosyl)aminobenzene 5'-phosphate synthase
VSKKILTVIIFLMFFIFAGFAWAAEIHDVAEKGDLNKVKALLEKDPRLINEKNDFGGTPLHVAAQAGQLEVVKFLFEKGADLNSKDMYGMTPLHAGVESEKSDVLGFLVARGAAINGKNLWGMTPLHWAALSGLDKSLEFLVENGADREAKDTSGRTPLHLGAWSGNRASVGLLLQKGALVNARDQGGDTPLHGAAYEGHKEVVDLLLANGADVNSKNIKGRTPSDGALRRGHTVVLELMAAKGGKCALNWSEEPAGTPPIRRNPEGERETVKLTVLSDNYCFAEGTKSEWGYSCLIEGTERTILFDTGTHPEVLQNNLDQLKVDLRKIGQVVISHDHEDHTGGLVTVLAKNHNLSVYLPYSSSYGLLRQAENTGAQVLMSRGPREICRNVFLEEEMATGAWVKEQSLILNTAQGLVIMTGCAHQGIIKVLKKAKEMFDRNIYLVFGGFHLLDKSADEIRTIITQFKELGVQNCGATHCTGPRAIKMFQEAYGDHFFPMGTGRVILIRGQG